MLYTFNVFLAVIFFKWLQWTLSGDFGYWISVDLVMGERVGMVENSNSNDNKNISNNNNRKRGGEEKK